MRAGSDEKHFLNSGSGLSKGLESRAGGILDFESNPLLRTLGRPDSSGNNRMRSRPRARARARPRSRRARLPTASPSCGRGPGFGDRPPIRGERPEPIGLKGATFFRIWGQTPIPLGRVAIGLSGVDPF